LAEGGRWPGDPAPAVVATLVPVKMSISDVLPGLGGAGFGEVALSTAMVRAFWRALRSLGAVTTKSTRRLPHRAQTSRFVPIGDRHLGAVAPGHFGWSGSTWCRQSSAEAARTLPLVVASSARGVDHRPR
jgi:hypothetical protein